MFVCAVNYSSLKGRKSAKTGGANFKKKKNQNLTKKIEISASLMQIFLWSLFAFILEARTKNCFAVCRILSSKAMFLYVATSD